jgi:hypothetical protein
MTLYNAVLVDPALAQDICRTAFEASRVFPLIGPTCPHDGEIR